MSNEDYSQGWINFGPIDPANLIRVLHEISSAQGMGFLSDSNAPLTDEDLKYWLDKLESVGETYLDYVRGRSVKKSIHKHNGDYLVYATSDNGAWYDHSDAELTEALARFGISVESEEKHGSYCQCDDCKPNHPIRDPDKALGMCGITDPTVGTGNFDREANSS